MDKSTKPPGRRRRSPGEGSVYQLADGRWRAAVSWTEGDGTRRRRVFTAKTPTEARAGLARLRDELRITGRVSPSIKVSEYLIGWLERDRARVRYSTHRSRELHVRRYLIPTIGDRKLATLTPLDVEKATTAIQREGRSPVTARHARATLRVALEDAVHDGVLARNVAAIARPPYAPEREIQYLDRSEIRQLVESTAGTQIGLIITVAVSTGARLGELLAISDDDLDLDRGTVRVRRSLALAPGGGWKLSEPKSSRSRRLIPTPPIAIEALRLALARRDAAREAAGDAWQDLRDHLVFTDEAGRPMSPRAVSSAYQRARAAAGVRNVPFHALRHSYATMALSEGVDLATISQMLGHSSIGVTVSHYAAVVPELRREAADALERVLR